MAATGLVYQVAGRHVGLRSTSRRSIKPLVGAIATYFCLNTGLVAIVDRALTTRSIGMADLARGLSLERDQASWSPAPPAPSRRW